MTRHSPRVSVILPCRNYGQFLGESLESLREQSLADWECIVVDDGSTDTTREVAADYATRDERIRPIRQDHAGVSAARNAGLRVATGPFVQFLDADDRLEPDKLRVHADYLDAHPDIDVAYGNAATFSEPAQLEDPVPLDLAPPNGRGDAAVLSFVVRNSLAIHAPLVRRAAVDRAGPFRLGMAHLEDWEFWMRCAISGAEFAHVVAPNTRALIRLHRVSASSDRHRMLTATVELRKAFASLPLPRTARSENERLLGRAQAKLALVDARRGRIHAAAAGAAEVFRALVGRVRQHESETVPPDNRPS